MPVLSSKRAFGGSTTSVNEQHIREHTVHWQVITDDVSMTGLEVLKQAASASPEPCPGIFTAFAGDLYAVCVTLDAKQKTETPLIWDVEAKFSTEQQTEEQQDQNPTLRASTYSVEFSQFQRIVETDIKGKHICNSLKQPFVPAIEQEDSRPILVAQRNFSTLDEVVGFMLEFKDAINSKEFYGAERRQAKVKSITAGTQQFENGYPYYPVTIRIEFKGEDETWDLKLLNTAMRFYPPNAAVPINPINTAMTNLGEDGTPASEPVPIDIHGRRIERSAVTGELLSDPVYRTFQTFVERDFARLGI